MRTTIENIIKGDYFPGFSFIIKDEKRITFGPINKNSNTVFCYVIGVSDYGRMGITLDISLTFLSNPKCLDWIVSEWYRAHSDEIKKIRNSRIW